MNVGVNGHIFEADLYEGETPPRSPDCFLLA